MCWARQIPARPSYESNAHIGVGVQQVQLSPSRLGAEEVEAVAISNKGEGQTIGKCLAGMNRHNAMRAVVNQGQRKFFPLFPIASSHWIHNSSSSKQKYVTVSQNRVEYPLPRLDGNKAGGKRRAIQQLCFHQSYMRRSTHQTGFRIAARLEPSRWVRCRQ